MKKILALVIIAAGLISCIFLTGCSGGQSTETKSAQPTAEKSTPPPLTTASPQQTPAETTFAYTSSSTTTIGVGSETIWLDIPIYPESKISFTQTISNPNENFSQEARRTYQTADEMTKVSAFYKSGMPASGWEEIAWKDEQGEINAQFGKNNKKDLAKINISVEKGQTYIIFVRYVPK